MTMHRSLVLLAGAGALAILASCAGPAPTAPPTAHPTPTPAAATQLPVAGTAPTSTPVAESPTSDNCLKCHSDKETLEKLAPKEAASSTETSGEG